MLDSQLRPLIDPSLNAIARLVTKAGLSANGITLIAMALCIPLFIALGFQAYSLAFVFVLANRFLDGLDGPVARASLDGATDFGGYLDILGDFLFYSGFVFFWGLGAGAQAPYAFFLLFSFFASGISFLAFAIMAEKQKLSAAAQGEKSFFYMAGLAEGTETILVFCIVCLFPPAFPVLAVLFGLLCWATAIERVMMARDMFRPT